METNKMTASMIPLEKSNKNERFITAFIASVIASLASVCFGFALGYTSPTEHKMESDERLNITKEEFSWFAVSLGIT